MVRHGSNNIVRVEIGESATLDSILTGDVPVPYKFRASLDMNDFLLTDLKQHGLMEDTLVLWTTEFGRMPTRQIGTVGRDHNPDGFALWMMGGGVKGGTSYGATDDFGRRAVENLTTIWEFYSTVLHILGLDYEQLSYYHNGLDRRLTDVH